MAFIVDIKIAFFSPGKFVAIHGTVVRVGNVKPLVTKMAFSCNLCGEIQVGINQRSWYFTDKSRTMLVKVKAAFIARKTSF